MNSMLAEAYRKLVMFGSSAGRSVTFDGYDDKQRADFDDLTAQRATSQRAE